MRDTTVGSSGTRAPRGLVVALAAGAVLAAAQALVAGPALAQENYNLAETHSAVYSTVYEDDSVWIWEAYYEPGEKGTPHSHAKPYTVYIVKGTTFRVTEEDGSVRDVELKVGAHFESPALKNHWGWNTDEQNDARFIIVQPK